MKIKSRSVLTGLTLLSLTSTVLMANPFKSPNQEQVFAQDTSSSCPLPQEIAITFLNAQCKETQLREPKVFYRYYSDSTNRYGRYLTSDRYEMNTDVISKLALNQDWGNKATMMLTVTLPAGTTIYEGIVGPQNPASCYPGGGQQTFIKDSKDPNIKWSEGTPMIVKEFNCP